MRSFVVPIPSPGPGFVRVFANAVIPGWSDGGVFPLSLKEGGGLRSAALLHWPAAGKFAVALLSSDAQRVWYVESPVDRSINVRFPPVLDKTQTPTVVDVVFDAVPSPASNLVCRFNPKSLDAMGGPPPVLVARLASTVGPCCFCKSGVLFGDACRCLTCSGTFGVDFQCAVTLGLAPAVEIVERIREARCPACDASLVVYGPVAACPRCRVTGGGLLSEHWLGDVVDPMLLWGDPPAVSVEPGSPACLLTPDGLFHARVLAVEPPFLLGKHSDHSLPNLAPGSVRSDAKMLSVAVVTHRGCSATSSVPPVSLLLDPFSESGKPAPKRVVSARYVGGDNSVPNYFPIDRRLLEIAVVVPPHGVARPLRLGDLAVDRPVVPSSLCRAYRDLFKVPETALRIAELGREAMPALLAVESQLRSGLYVTPAKTAGEPEFARLDRAKFDAIAARCLRLSEKSAAVPPSVLPVPAGS